MRRGPPQQRLEELKDMPLSARIAIIASLMALCAGAAYLMFARGQVILMDLSASAAQLLCL
jgi:hypothetical protein